jgi:AcrR family transcriptional regulator
MDRKEEILKAAYEIVGQDGLESLHARSIAAKIGVNHALVHYYFRRREDLLLGVAEYMLRRFDTDVAHFQASATDPKARVEASFLQCEAYCKPASRLYRVWASLFVAAQTSRTLRKALLGFWAEWTERLNAHLEEAASRGDVNAESPFSDPRLLLSTLLGVGLMAQLAGEAGDATRQLDAIDDSLMA